MTHVDCTWVMNQKKMYTYCKMVDFRTKKQKRRNAELVHGFVPNVVTPGSRKKIVIDGVMRLGLGVKREIIEGVYPLAQYIYERGSSETTARYLVYTTVIMMELAFSFVNRVANMTFEKVLDRTPLTANWRMVNYKPMSRLHRAMANVGIVEPRLLKSQMNNWRNKAPSMNPLSLLLGGTVFRIPMWLTYGVVKPEIFFAKSSILGVYSVVFVMRLLDALMLQKRNLANAANVGKNMAVTNLKRVRRVFKTAWDILMKLLQLQKSIDEVYGPKVKGVTSFITSGLKAMLKVNDLEKAQQLLFPPTSTLALPST